MEKYTSFFYSILVSVLFQFKYYFLRFRHGLLSAHDHPGYLELKYNNRKHGYVFIYNIH